MKFPSKRCIEEIVEYSFFFERLIQSAHEIPLRDVDEELLKYLWVFHAVASYANFYDEIGSALKIKKGETFSGYIQKITKKVKNISTFLNAVEKIIENDSLTDEEKIQKVRDVVRSAKSMV